MGFNPFSGRGLVAGMTWGLSELAGENTMSKVPVLNSIGGFEPDSKQALLKTQEEMAADAKKRQKEMEQARMAAIGQKLLAFNPQNQMKAEMFGPSAAFSPQQMAQMGENPNGPPRLDPSLEGYQGNDPNKQAEIRSFREAQAADQRRREMLNGMTPLPRGPAPLQQRTPQAARRF